MFGDFEKLDTKSNEHVPTPKGALLTILVIPSVNFVILISPGEERHVLSTL